MSYRGGDGKRADFTPVQGKLSTVQVRPAASAAALAANARADEPRNGDERTSKEKRRRSQDER